MNLTEEAERLVTFGRVLTVLELSGEVTAYYGRHQVAVQQAYQSCGHIGQDHGLRYEISALDAETCPLELANDALLSVPAAELTDFELEGESLLPVEAVS